jgi:hypothetical protein
MPILLFALNSSAYLVPKKPPDIAIGGWLTSGRVWTPTQKASGLGWLVGLFGAYLTRPPKKPPDIAIGGSAANGSRSGLT